MKKLVTILAAVALLALGTAALAADTATVNVQAIVTGSCYFNSAVAATNPAIALNFPNYASGLANPAALTASQGVNVYCPNGTPWLITPSAGPYTLSSGANTINYQLDLNGTVAPAALAGTGSGAAQLVTITGTIAAGNIAAGQVPGVYTQTVTLSLTP
jgi:spore coat protein U-like protein